MSDDVDRWIRYHSEVAYVLTSQRTALESALIPVSAYILVACVEAYRRYPEMIRTIADAASPETLGRAGHRLATQIDPVHLWAVPNFPLVGRKVLMTAGLVDRDDDEQRLATIFDFWSRAARAYRFEDGTHQAWDASGAATPYRDLVDEIVDACAPIGEDRVRVSRLNALLTSYLFLLWFDTRSGYQDTGPYLLADGRVLLLRAYNRLGVSHFPWSADVADAMPHSEVLGAFVLRDVDLSVTDFGTSVTRPDDYWPHVERFAFFDTSDGALDVVPLADLAARTRRGLGIVEQEAEGFESERPVFLRCLAPQLGPKSFGADLETLARKGDIVVTDDDQAFESRYDQIGPVPGRACFGAQVQAQEAGESVFLREVEMPEAHASGR